MRRRPEAPPRDLFNKDEKPKPQANLAKSAWGLLKKHWSLRGDMAGEAAAKLTEALFHLTLAMGHSPSYEEDHKDGLAQDWIHLPIPRDKKLLEETSALGETIALLLDPARDPTRAMKGILAQGQRVLGVVAVQESDRVSESEFVVEHSFYGAAAGGWRERAPASNEELPEAWGQVTGDLYLNDRVFFQNVPAAVWRFELGGYPVLKKWLGYRETKRRNGRPLTLAEAQHFREMIHRIAALLLLHARLDAAYEEIAADSYTAEELGLG